LSYIWLLLTFSYMMLYRFDRIDNEHPLPHWTEIYVTITITTMLFEDIRRLKDLFIFITIIFISIMAYGVASRSLFMYNNIDFTARGLFGTILYPAYWLIYYVVDEKDVINDIILDNNQTSVLVAQAQATQVLLAFQMLFINILILNLLIAVFTFKASFLHIRLQFEEFD
ncbi:unnamed protein product, partial [Didymodactylos carnosus]